MIVDRIEPLPLRIPLRAVSAVPTAALDALHLVLCRVTTKSGLVGYGESLCYTAQLQRALVATIEDFVAPAFVGQSVSARAELNTVFRRKGAALGRAGTSINALAAVDIALWDIAGKEAGLPLAAMIGGCRRSEVAVMASLDKHDDARSIRQRVDDARRRGAEAVKVHETDIDVIEAARAVATGIAFVADLNNGRSAATLKEDEARWRALDLLWLEDPIWPPEDLLDRSPLAGVRIGVGGELGSAEQLGTYARAPSIGVIQPDVCMLGGISEAIAGLRACKAAGRAIAPHTPYVGPAALASVHVIATLDEEAYFAMIDAPSVDPYGIGIARWRRSIAVPEGPGLGFDPDPAFLQRYAASR